MNNQKMKSFVLNNPHLVDMKATSNPELFVLKYKKKVFYDNLWTPELLECRGTIVDKDFNVISRPFTKVFNYLEPVGSVLSRMGKGNGTKIDRDTMCTYVRKVNGFMAAVTLYKGEILISTTGSIDSDFVKMAEKQLNPYLEKIKKDILEGQNYTLLFEIVDKEDPHIIEEQVGAYLIGCQWKTWINYDMSEEMLDHIAKDIGCPRPEWKVARFSDILKEVKTVKHEGFMVYGDCGTTLKIKSPYYLSKKALMRMGAKQADVMFDKPDVFRKRLDEEFYILHESLIHSQTKEEWLSWNEQERRQWIETWMENYYNE